MDERVREEQSDPTEEQPARPVDVDTGFGLWLSALTTLVIGQAVDTALSSRGPAEYIRDAFTALMLVLVSVLVVTFLLLMRQGYRWARTVLTGGGVATIGYVISSLFTVERDTIPAVIFAVTGIFGSVLIAGGVYLLHRKDAQAYFTR
jgi:CHASE2 domain-containing sensor protein